MLPPPRGQTTIVDSRHQVIAVTPTKKVRTCGFADSYGAPV